MRDDPKSAARHGAIRSVSTRLRDLSSRRRKGFGGRLAKGKGCERRENFLFLFFFLFSVFLCFVWLLACGMHPLASVTQRNAEVALSFHRYRYTALFHSSLCRSSDVFIHISGIIRSILPHRTSVIDSPDLLWLACGEGEPARQK